MTSALPQASSPLAGAGVSPLAPVSIQNIFLHVTKACNLRCRYCYFSADKPEPDEMTVGDFDKLWPQVVDLAPRKVVFTGGEPLTRSDIFDLLAGLQSADHGGQVRRCLNTNGHFVTPDLARRLVGLADEVRVSLDALSERNDALRGTGNFAAAVRALDILYGHGFEPKVLITVTAVSLPDLEELVCFLLRRNIRRINVNVFRPIGRGGTHPEWTIEIAAAHAMIRRAWVRIYPDQPLGLGPEQLQRISDNCGVGRFLNVLPNGDVYPCHVLIQPEFRLGNLRQETLNMICSRQGLLGALADVSFADLKSHDPRLLPLSLPNSCMGAVYADNRSLPVWGNILPLKMK